MPLCQNGLVTTTPEMPRISLRSSTVVALDVARAAGHEDDDGGKYLVQVKQLSDRLRQVRQESDRAPRERGERGLTNGNLLPV